MMQFYIGDSQEYIAVQYAKSNRSGCRECKQKIAKDQLRVGLLLDDDHFAASYWYHLNCFHFKPRHKVLDVETLEQMIYGIEDLDPKDCDKAIDYLKEELQNFKENKSGKKKTKTKKLKHQDQDDDDQKQEVKGKNASVISKSQNKDAESQQKKKKITKSKNEKQVKKKFMSAEQKKQYKELYDEYHQLTLNQLKEILYKNGQSKTGTKDQLVSKCADGKMFGRIPPCTSCGGGKLRFDIQNGTYKCPGYMQDTDFKNCGAKFTFEQITRTEWTN